MPAMVVTGLSFVSIVAILKSVMCTCPERQRLMCNRLGFNFTQEIALNQKRTVKYSMERSFRVKKSGGRTDRKYFSLQAACRCLLFQISLYFLSGEPQNASFPKSNLVRIVLSLPIFYGQSGGKK